MKLHGKKIDPASETLVLPRSSGDLVFIATAVASYENFDKLCPHPVPPTIKRPGQPEAQDTTDKDYLKALDQWASCRTAWMIIESLNATPGIEWETVKPSEPTTWLNFQKELEASGLTQGECMRVINIVLDANGLNEKKIEAATKNFLAGAAAKPATV